MRRIGSTTALAALLLLSLIPLARGQGVGVVGVQISPVIIEQDLDGRGFVTEVTITNNEPEARDIDLRITGLGHDLDGTPQFPQPSEASDAITIEGERRFTLQAGTSQRVTLRGRIPNDQPSLYAGLVARFAQPSETGGQIAVRSQVTSLMLLRGPKPWRQTLEPLDAGVLQNPAAEQTGSCAPYTVFGAAENTGNVHFYVAGTARITKDGQLVDKVSLKRNAIIPGYARRIGGIWEPAEVPDGSYHIEASLRSPKITVEGDVEFIDGCLETALVEVTDLATDGKVVRATIANSGTLPIAPVLTFTASRDNEQAATKVVPLDELEPDAREVVTWEPDVGAGTYDIALKVATADGDLLDQEVTGLRVPGFPWLWVVVAVVIVLLLIVLFFLWRRRRRDRRPAPPRARAARATPQPAAQPQTSTRPPGMPPPPPPPPPGR